MSAPMRVVIADDSSDIRRMLRLSLELDGDFEVVGEAGDGEQAVSLVEKEHPDAIILDLAMPVMDGLQAIVHIRERSPLTRIVVLSGFNASQMATKARSLGADAYLEKGTAFNDVATLLRGLHTRDRAAEGPVSHLAAGAPPDSVTMGAGFEASDAPTSLATTIAGASDLDTAFGLLSAAAQDAMDFDRASFAVITDESERFEVLATAGSAAWRLPVGSSLVLEREGLDVLRQGRPWVVADTAARRDLPSVAELSERGLRSFVTVPVVIGGRLRATVSFASLKSGGVEPDAAASLAATVEPVGAVLHVLALLESERDAGRRMRDLDRLRSDFVGMVAHDLRAPMTVIAGFAEGLERGWDVLDDEHKREFIGRISRNISSLTALVEDVLTVSHIQSREFQLDVRPIDLGPLLRACVTEIAEGHPERRIVVDVPEDLSAVHGDALRQRQVICNLVGNALKFSPAEEPITVSARTADGAVEIAVTDLGIGVDAEELPRLFERFYRTDGGKAHDRSGTGLGLYICKSLIESWGGTIRVDSRLGAGSTFTYTTPVADDSDDAPATTITADTDYSAVGG